LPTAPSPRSRRSSPRSPSPLPLRARSRRRRARADRATLGLAIVAVGGAAAAAATQFGRLLNRRSHEPDDGESLIEAAPAAAIDTVGVAVTGYAETPRNETILFNLLSGFLGSFALIRLSTLGVRRKWRPFRDIHVGERHIHHFVPGIVLAFGSGTVAMLTEDEALEEALAVPFGAGMGLTFDEAALLLDLRDVYWTRQGLLSVQLSLGATAILSIAILTLRMLRRGERRQESAGQIPPPAHATVPG
jgi:hypothetical protein